ncbi:MAG: FAD-dependent oxidoreductase [Promethearchaeota archaeon]
MVEERHHQSLKVVSPCPFMQYPSNTGGSWIGGSPFLSKLKISIPSHQEIYLIIYEAWRFFNAMEDIIIGAGPAALSAGYSFAKHDIAPLLLEKDSRIGGLSKTHEVTFEGDTYMFDQGPHRFFSQNPDLYVMIEELLGEDWLVVDRLTRQLIDGKYYDYPVNVVQALKNVGPARAFRMMLDFLLATAKKLLGTSSKESFEDWIVSNFGRTLAEFNMLNYTEKIWGIPCSQISGAWAAQRIKGMNAFDIVKKALIKGGGPRSMVDSFYYPRHGIQQIYDSMATFIEGNGGEIKRSVDISRINLDGTSIKSIEFSDGAGKKHEKHVKSLISSMPITDLVQLFSPAAPKAVVKAANALGYRDQVQVFLIIDKPKITEDTWIYFPTTPPTFGRMMEPKNWVDTMSPENRSSLLVEYFVFKNDETWNLTDDAIINKTMREIEWLGFAKKEQLLDGHVYRIEKSYPKWNLTYKKHLDIIYDYVNSFENLYCVGRNGRFYYNNQDHSIETGLLAAQSVIEGKRYDLDKIGMEDTYFEAGMLHGKK